MYISHIRLTNWRNFLSLDVPLGLRTFIVGANASGKSNFLDVFRFLQDIAKQSAGGFYTAVESRGGVSKIRNLNARTPSEVKIEVELSNPGDKIWSWKYAIAFTLTSRGKHTPILKFEKVWRNGEETPFLSRPTPEEKSQDDSSVMTETWLQQNGRNREFREIADCFSGINYFHLVPQLLRNPEMFLLQNPSNDPYGLGFLNKIAETNKKTRDSRFRILNKILPCAIPHLKNLSFSKDSKGRPHLDAIYEHWRLNAGHQDELQFSDGTLRLIAILWALMESKGISLFEEPELSLHNQIVEKLPELLALTQQNSINSRQYFLTTHSDHLLADPGIPLSEILVLSPSEQGTNCSLASANPQWREMLKEGFTPAEIVLPETSPRNIAKMPEQFLIPCFAE